MAAKIPARLRKSGRVTVPADVRRALDLEPGDYVWLAIEPVEEVER